MVDQATVVQVTEATRGRGVPLGGLTGQVLAKVTGADFATDWVDLPEFLEPTPGDKGDIVIAGGVWSIDETAPNIVNKVQNIATRAALADLQTAAVAHFDNSLWLFTGGDQSANVTADVRQGIFVAPSAAPSGAAGAWVRQFSGAVQAHWFGTVGDGVADDFAALTAAAAVASFLENRVVFIRAGTYAVQTALDPPSGVTIEGAGASTVIFAAGAAIRAFNPVLKGELVLRNMTLRGANATAWRAAIYADQCTGCRFENLRFDGITNSTGIYMVECDYCTADNVYFECDIASPNGYGVYMLACQGCKTINSTAINCFGGFVMSGQGTDAFVTRTMADTFGNIIANCYVQNCTSQAFNINSCTASVITGCTAEGYSGDDGIGGGPGSGIHKAFQIKDADTSEGSSTGNMIIGCTAKNYAAGFGVVRAARCVFAGCSGENLSTNFIEIVDSVGCTFNGMSCIEFGSRVAAGPYAGVYISGTSTRNRIETKLQTSSAVAKGILFSSIQPCNLNTFDVQVGSTLAAFCDINAASLGNEFLPGCRSNDNAIIDASNASIWPFKFATPVFTLTATSTNHMIGGYVPRGLNVAIARFVVTTTITGTPQIRVGDSSASTSIAAAQAVAGAAGTTVVLALANAIVGLAKLLTGGCAAAGTAGGGYVQLEGLMRS